MDRRRFLTTATVIGAIGAAGCGGRLAPFAGPWDGVGMSLAGVDEPGEEVPFAVDVTPKPGPSGIDGAPGLGITLENTGEEALFVGYPAWPESVFPGRESDPPALRLLTGAEVESLEGLSALETRTEGRRCVRTEYSPDEDPPAHRLPAGERGRGRYAVVGSSQHLEEGCPAAGEYAFRSEYSYAPASAVEEARTHDAVDWREFAWGFTVEVEPTE